MCLPSIPAAIIVGHTNLQGATPPHDRDGSPGIGFIVFRSGGKNQGRQYGSSRAALSA
jgi:hypothetical protein